MIFKIHLFWIIRSFYINKDNFEFVQLNFQVKFSSKILKFNLLIFDNEHFSSIYKDNFEFVQWFKKFFDANYDGTIYPALQQRGGLHIGR